MYLLSDKCNHLVPRRSHLATKSTGRDASNERYWEGKLGLSIALILSVIEGGTSDKGIFEFELLVLDIAL
jgi:hypothetical protein